MANDGNRLLGSRRDMSNLPLLFNVSTQANANIPTELPQTTEKKVYDICIIADLYGKCHVNVRRSEHAVTG